MDLFLIKALIDAVCIPELDDGDAESFANAPVSQAFTGLQIWWRADSTPSIAMGTVLSKHYPGIRYGCKLHAGR